MIALKKILVPTDFSERSRFALRYACELAGRFQSELHLLHVMENLTAVAGETDGFYSLPEDFQTELKDKVREQLDELAKSIREDVGNIVQDVRKGAPFVEIVQYAKQKDVDLIVMGTHGRGALAHALMGSVAEKVVRKAPCPVLTVRHPEHEFIKP